MIRANQVPSRTSTKPKPKERSLPVAVRLSLRDFARLCAIKPHALKPGEVPTLPGTGLRMYADPTTPDGEAAKMTQEEERELRTTLELHFFQ